MLKLSIIIPVYNEQDLVLQVIDRLHEVEFPKEITSFEIVVVDDCSSDNSYSNLEAYEKAGKIALHKHEVNQGKGAAVKTGVKQSSGEIFIIQDSDLELDPFDIPLMIETMFRLNIEFVNGSRYMPGKIRPLYGYKRYYFNKVFTRWASILINVRFTDIACGYKLLTRDLYDRLNLKEKRFGIEAEMIIKAARKRKTSIAEVPVNYFPRNVGEGKKIRNRDGFRIWWVIIKYGLFKRS